MKERLSETPCQKAAYEQISYFFSFLSISLGKKSIPGDLPHLAPLISFLTSCIDLSQFTISCELIMISSSNASTSDLSQSLRKK